MNNEIQYNTEQTKKPYAVPEMEVVEFKCKQSVLQVCSTCNDEEVGVDLIKP